MDWVTSLQALTSKATSSYEDLLKRWQELLKKASRGELAPESLEDQLPQFLQDEGGEFYRRLAALSFELSNALAEVQTKSMDDFMRGLLGDSIVTDPLPSTPPIPPAADGAPDEWSQWYQSVTTCIAEQNERSLARYQILLEKVADGRLTPKSVQEFSRKFIYERALVLSGEAGAAQVEFYESLLQLNREFLESLFARLVRKDEIRSEESDEPLRLELRGATEMAPAAIPVFRTASPTAAATGKTTRSPGPKRKKKTPAKRPRKKAAR